MVVGSLGAAAAAARCGGLRRFASDLRAIRERLAAVRERHASDSRATCGGFGDSRLGDGSAALLARRQHLALTRSTSPGYYALPHHMVHISLFNSLFSLPLLGVSAQCRDPTSDTNVKVLGLNLLSLKLTRHTQMP